MNHFPSARYEYVLQNRWHFKQCEGRLLWESPCWYPHEDFSFKYTRLVAYETSSSISSVACETEKVALWRDLDHNCTKIFNANILESKVRLHENCSIQNSDKVGKTMLLMPLKKKGY